MRRLQTKKATITHGNKTICRELSLTMQTGQAWGILGANGSGKSTILHTLAGLHPTQEGEIWLNDDKITNLSPKAIAQSIAILFQDFTDTFPQTVWDYCKAARFPHLAYFQKANRRDWQVVTEALQTVDLYSLATRHVAHLSGGEKRRLALASVLSQTPHFYLLDEPTNHLDVRHQMGALNHFHQLVVRQSAAVMMSLHDVNLAHHFCTHILLLYPDGRTIQGRTQEILTAANLSSLYQHEMAPIHTLNGMYWQPKSDITKTM